MRAGLADIAGPGGGDPGWVAGVVVQTRDGGLEVGDELDTAGAVTDDSYGLAGRVEGRVPVGSMAENALVVGDAGVVGELPGVEAADGSDDAVGLFDGCLAGLEVLDGYLPDRLGVVPVEAFDFGVEACVLVDVVLLCYALPVVADLGTAGELVAPVKLGLKGRLVDVRGDVTSYSGIDVLEPSTTLVVC